MTAGATVPRERPLEFGPGNGLVGVLATAAPPAAEREGDLAVLFVNAGILHRVGPNRIHVRLARTLARGGIPSLRMDLPGIGDSRTPWPGVAPMDQNQLAIREALDLLGRLGVASRVVVFGLCSGAGDAFRAACVDARVVGVCLVDPPRLFATRKSVALRVLRWLVRPRAWLRLLSGRYRILEQLRARRGAGPAEAVGPPPPSAAEVRAAVEAGFRAMAERGVRVCHVVTGDQRETYNYRRQLLDTFPDVGLEATARLELFAEAQHTFPSEASRRRLEATVVDWVAGTPFVRPLTDAAPTPGAGDAAEPTRPLERRIG